MTIEQYKDAQHFWLDHLATANNFNQWIFEAFEHWLHGEILELGCGMGAYTTLMAESGWHVTGLDIEQDFVEIAAQRVARCPNAHVRRADITQIGDSTRYDTVILLDVLEHIEDDVGLLLSIAARLRPGGRLILKVPALPSIYSEMDEAIGHYRRYDRTTLKARLVEAGFEPITIQSLNTLGILGWWLNGKVLGRTTPPAAQLSVFNRIIPVVSHIERILRVPFGLSMLSLAKKKDS